MTITTEYKSEALDRKFTKVFTGVMEYLGIALVTALPAIFAVAQNVNPSSEVQLRASSDPNALVWSYSGEYHARNFKDIRPFGSLDEVVLRTKEGKVVTLQRGDDGFAEQEQVYSKIIVLYMDK